ncbi:MAG: Cell division protein ZapE [Hyphomicrobiaceae bacterium hypho_1]
MLKLYNVRVANGELQHDNAQKLAAERLDTLATQLESWLKSQTSIRHLLGQTKPAPNGLYIHGSVGRGKTMLMDMFYESVSFKHKHRSHFHEFMVDVHERIGKARKTIEADPILRVAKQISTQAKLLCFDEFHVTDIADAMILGRLFKVLFKEDVIVVTTSNSHPYELYRNGLNRQLFLPFIDLITSKMDIIDLSIDKDFRMEKLAGRRIYFSPLNDDTNKNMDALWVELTNGAANKSRLIEVKGRLIEVKRTAKGGARFHFNELCSTPLGSADYIALAQAFHTIMIDAIPILTPARRNEARRFINLIDTLYDNKIRFVASSEAEPSKIYPLGHGSDLFKRTVSRLIEMSSETYLNSRFQKNIAEIRDPLCC